MSALVLCLATLILLFWRPFNLALWVYSSLAAFLAFILKLVDFEDAKFIFDLIWDSSLTLIGLILLSFSLEALGFFDFLAYGILKFSRKNKQEIDTYKLMFFMLIFVFFLATFFANDGAILVITPIIITLFSTLKDKNSQSILIAFLFALSFLCDAGSNLFVISNLTNIITANYFKLDFLSFAYTMLVPSLFVFISTLIMVFVIFRRILPKKLEFNFIQKNEGSKALFIFCLIFLMFFTLGFFIAQNYGLSKGIFILGAALIFWLIVSVLKPKQGLKIFQNSPWGVLIFSFGLYLVVFSLYKVGAGEILIKIYTFLMQDKDFGIFGTGLVSALGSSLFNNLPMVLIGDLALKEYFSANSFEKLMIYAHLLGVNIGAKLTPIGSLATLLWLGILVRKGVEISFWQYTKFGFSITLIVLMSALFGLLL